MGFVDLLVVASIPVAKGLLVTAVGLIMALDRIDLLGENSRHHLNKIVFYVFSPSLIAANLAKTITFQNFLTLWFMPINILITFTIGAILGWLLVKVTRPPKHLTGLIIGACSAGNMGNLPIILVPAMCKEKGSPFGATDVCETYALSYASLSMAVSLPVKINQRIRTFLEKANLKAVFAPSTIAAILGFAIGMISPIQKLMIGNEAPLRVLADSAFMLGEAAIPARTIILGANLLKGLKGTSIQLRVILGIVLTRYIILPMFGIVIVKGALQAGLVPSHDKLLLFLLHIQYAMPPAMNIGTMTQLFGSGQSECSVIMLWAYSLAIVALTLWSILFLWIVT